MFESDYRQTVEAVGPSKDQMDRLFSVIHSEKAPRAASRRPLRLGLALALAAALCAGGVMAAPPLLTMAGEVVDYLKVPAQFRSLSQQISPQPFSSAAGLSATDQGYTLTVDEIAIDDAFATLYYTITGEEPIPLNQDGTAALTSLRLKADGDILEFWDRDIATELVDEHTLRAIQRCPVLRALPDVTTLEIYSDELFWGLSGTWQLSLAVDKSLPAAESLVSQPKQSFSIDGHQVTVDKVVVAPSGGGLVLTAASDRPLTQFILRDDQGTYLPTRTWGLVSRPILPVSNFIEFYGGRTDMSSITLIPWSSSGGNREVVGSLTQLPLDGGQGDNGYTLLSVEIGPEAAVATFRSAGTLGQSDQFCPEFDLLDADGRLLSGSEPWHMDRTRDGETGLWTVTLHYPADGDLIQARAAQVRFWQPQLTLLEDQAVTISLPVSSKPD